MPRSASRSGGRSTESPAAKPATRKSVRAVASPSPKAKSSPAPAAAAATSRSRSTTKSPAASKSPSTPAARSRSRTATPAETKSTPAAKGRSRSKSAAKEPETKKKAAEPAAKSPAVKGAGAKSKKATPSSAAKTKSAKSPATKSRSSSAKKSAESSSPSPKKKTSASPKKASSKKAAETPKKSPVKKTPQRGRSSSRKGKQEEEEEEEAPEVEKAEDGEEEAVKPDEGQADKSGVDETDAAAETAEKSDKKEDEKPAAEVAETKDEEMKTDEAETAASTTETPDINEKMEGTSAVSTSPDAASRKRKREDEEENTGAVDAKVQKVSDEVVGDGKASTDVPMEDGDNGTKETTDAAADVDDGDYILISTDDVPAADSDEMQQVAAKMKEPTPAVVVDGCIGANGCGEDPVLSRTFAANAAAVEPADASRCFTLASYNILADCHAVNDYTGDLAPWISDEQLAIPARHRRLMEELKYLDADIICLQEVGGDHMNDLLKPELETLGYNGVYIPRNTKLYTEGEATFYRTSRFSLVSSESLLLSDLIDAAVDESSGLEADKKELVKASLSTHAVAMLTRLKDVNSDKTVAVANIHVAYDKFERQDRQCIQLATAVQKLVQLAGGADKPHVICGDFNSWAGTPPYQLMSDGSLNDASLVALQSIESIDAGEDQSVPVVNLWADGFQLPIGGDLKSAYSTVTGAEPLTSRYARDARVLPLDYIWFSSVSLDVLGVLKVIDPALITTGIPTTVFPSDHLSIKARFAFK